MVLNNNAKGYMAVAGSFLLALSLGNFYTLGNLSPYITSYLRVRVDPNFTDSYMIWVNGFFMLGDGLLMPFGGYLAPKLGSRPIMTAGCIVFSGFSAFSAYTITVGFVPFCVTYGFLSWVGAGVMSSIVIGEIMKWFPAYKGLVSGLVVSGFGFGGFILNSVQAAIINPDNLSPDKNGFFSNEELLDRVPNIFWITALMISVLQVIGIILLFTPPGNSSEDTHPPYNSTFRYQLNPEDDCPSKISIHGNNGNNSTNQVEACRSKEQLTVIENSKGRHPLELFKSSEFYVIWLIFACLMMPVSYLLTYYKNYGLTFIPDDRYLSLIGAIGAFVSCIGKISFGILLDKTSYKLALSILCGCISICVQLLYAAQFIEEKSSLGCKVYFTIIFFLGYVNVGGIYGIIAAVAGSAFGLRYAGANFGILFSSQALGSFGGAFLVQTIQDKLKWTWGSFTSVVAFGVFSLFLCILLKKNQH